jgi:MOSC domain-containing protein YiiM
MRVVSVNVGLPRAVAWRGKTVTTAIFKAPIAGRVALRSLNLDGDRQADLAVHGGRESGVRLSR